MHLFFSQHEQHVWDPNILPGNLQANHFHSSVTYRTHPPFAAALECVSVPMVLANL